MKVANETLKKSSPSAVSAYKKKLGAFFNSLSVDLKASSKRVQLYGDILLNTLIESDAYAGDLLSEADAYLLSKDGVAAFKNALRFYNIGITALTDSSAGATDLDGMSDGYKTHVALGLELFDQTVSLEGLKEKEALYWQILRDVLAFHHERWDGTGYPAGRYDTQIPISARICAVINEFETLTTSSFERDKMTTEAAAEEITRRSNTYFDAKVVQALNDSVDKINEVLENGTLARVTAGNASVRAIEQLYRSVYDYGNHMPYGYLTDLRLNDAELGVVHSSVFLPVAEKSSKINELTKWSVEEACNTINYLKKRKRFSGVFFLPLSVKSLLKKHFDSNVAGIAKQAGVDAEELCFVVSENVFSFNTDRVAEALAGLHHLGFKVAIGNFGSDAVNIAALQKLELDYLFLNAAFVADIVTGLRAKKVAASVIDLGNKLDIMVIADGVVNKEQAKELYSMGCNIMCGSYYGRFTAVTVI